MRDPFPIPPPPALVAALQPYADAVSLSTLPLHAHEVIFAFALYTFIATTLGPRLSTFLCGTHYTGLSARTKTNWNVHVVSFCQSCIICAFSLYIIFCDEERKAWRRDGAWEERIWGYTGLTGLGQSFALGYFLWDLWMCAYHVEIFGWGMLAHAICATSVFSLGYRPLVHFYGPIFLLYELSSPFLNIHWFCDKLELTGSVYQAVNGAILTTTFFLCRICWGLYNSWRILSDMSTAIGAGHAVPPTGIMGEEKPLLGNRGNSGDAGLYWREHDGLAGGWMGGQQYLPLWLAATYLSANLVLNCLNLFWFHKMVQTIRARFNPPWGTKGVGPAVIHYQPQEKVATEVGEVRIEGNGSAQERADALMGGGGRVADEAAEVQRGIYADGHKSVEVTGTTRRTPRSRRKA